MATEFITLGYDIISGGTDNHLFVIDLRNKNITGKGAEKVLEKLVFLFLAQQFQMTQIHHLILRVFA